MKIIFMGTPDFAVYGLEALHKSEHEILAVVTVPDKAQGRGKKIKASPVKEKAIELEYEILQPENLKDSTFLEQIEDFDPEAIVVIAFRKLPEELIDIPAFGAINIHGSLLPKYRGAAPINHAIMNGEKETGVTSFYINEEIDAGTILLQKKTLIGEKETFGDIYYKLAHLGADLIAETLDKLDTEGIDFRVQDLTQVSKAPKIFQKDAEINFENSAEKIYNQIRGLSPIPVAFSFLEEKKFKIYFADFEKTDEFSSFKNGQICFVDKKHFKIKCSDGVIIPKRVQLQGKKEMDVSSFLNGVKLETGMLFSHAKS
jgi:methionyl-tRNA formyltransferase